MRKRRVKNQKLARVSEHRVRRGILLGLCVTLAVVAGSLVLAHSVGQVQTTKFFAPETRNMLIARATAGNPGLQVGDIVSYIIQFTPVDNGGATVGAGGYITDYIPAGTEVVGASFVMPNGTDTNGDTIYTNVAPNLPGPISNGWGPKASHTYLAPFNVAYSATAGAGYDDRAPSSTPGTAGGTGTGAANSGMCFNTTPRPATNACDGSLAQVYADTGIFFSTDSRTAVVADASGRIKQNGNGLSINPTGSGGLLGYVGVTTGLATTHNHWDAAQTNAFGSNSLTGVSATTPASSILVAGSNIGRGVTPFNAGSAVAGPDSGYKLDNTGNVGPWRRIAYAGSRVGNPTSAATSATSSNTTLGVVNSATAVVGVPTSAGWDLSPSNPLPAGTNAVRWAAGQLVVGELRYVKISLRITAVPSGGLINNSEVFGGDSAEAAGKAGNDNPWRYHVPSVADNNSNIYIYKEIVSVNGVPGSSIPAGVPLTIRYKITYVNIGNTSQTNIGVSDTLRLPCTDTTATPASTFATPTVTFVSDSRAVATQRSALTFTTGTNCGAGTETPSTTAFSFQTSAGSNNLGTLAAGQGGNIVIDVGYPAVPVGRSIQNSATFTSTQISGGVSSSSAAPTVSTAVLQLTKSVLTPSPADVQPGGTVTYQIKVTNTGAANASSIVVNDYLPTSGGTTASTRFSFGSVSSVTKTSGATTTTLTSPTNYTQLTSTASASFPVPYTNQNRERVTWNFTPTLAPGDYFTITFTATVGASVPASTTPYTNDAVASYNNTLTTLEASVTNAAPVSVGYRLSGKVFEDYNYGGGAGRAYDSVLGMYQVPNARVELYNSSGTYVTSITTDASGNYTFTGLVAGNYTVRVANRTVASQRPGGAGCLIAASPCIPVQTFRTNASTGAAAPVTNKVGGEDPVKVDAGSNTTNATLASLTAGSATPESITAVTIGSSNITGLDFGFNFDTIVNKNDGGQGSLRQFIINSNGLGGESFLAQSGNRLARVALADTSLSPATLPSGKESSIFMIPSSQLVSGVASINLQTLLPAVSNTTNPSYAENTIIDGTTQSVNIGNSNLGTLGTGGTVGVDALTLPVMQKPEVEITDGAGLARGLDIQSNNTTVRGLGLYGFGNTRTPAGDANIRVGSSAATNYTGTLIEENILGIPASSTSISDPGAGVRGGGDGFVAIGADSGIFRYNLTAFNELMGAMWTTTANNWTIASNESRSNGISATVLNQDGFSVEGSSTGATITGNLSINNGANGIELIGSTGQVTNNTIIGNGFQNVETAGIRIAGTGYTIYRNIISANTGAGVMMRSGVSTTISQNSIFANGTIGSTPTNQIGIDLHAASGDNPQTGTAPYVSLNESNDADTGANDLLNYPVIENAVIQGTSLVVTGWARPGSLIEFFIADPDASSFGEGKTYVISRIEGSSTSGQTDNDATSSLYGPSAINGIAQGTDTTNRFSFSIALSSLPGVAQGTKLTATATCLTANSCTSAANGSTSEFSGLAIVTGIDYGDAPDLAAGTATGNYATLSSDGGPSHFIVTGLAIGTAVDGDSGAAQNAAADADDTTNTDDEDGVASFPALGFNATSYSVSVNVTNSTGTDAYLVGYIDFNRDGDFADPGETSATVTIASNTTNPRSVAVNFSSLAGGVSGVSYARFRLSSTQAQAESSIGAATSGEVEDYQLPIYGVSPLASGLIINEVYYAQIGATAAANDEFIELYNVGGSSINLTTLKLLDGNLIAADTDTIGSITGSAAPFSFSCIGVQICSGSTTLAPGQYAVIWIGSQDLTTKNATNATFQAWLGQAPKLANTGDDVWLYDSNNDIVDYMAFGSGSAINTLPPTSLGLWNGGNAPVTAVNGQSLSLTPNGANANDGRCWEITTATGANTAASRGCPIASYSTRDTDTQIIGGTARITSAGEFNNFRSDLAITKTGSSSVATGASVTYTITVWNNGPDNVTLASVTDTMPTELTAVSWTCTATGAADCDSTVVGTGATGTGNIALTKVNLNTDTGAATSADANYLTITVTATAPATIPATNPFTNTATATVPTTIQDPVGTNNSSSQATTITLNAKLGLAKALDRILPASNAASNNDYTLVYRFTAENFSNLTLTNLEIFDDVVTQFAGLNPRNYNTWLAVPVNAALLSPAATLTLNTSYNGAATSNVLNAGQSLNATSTAVIYISFEVTVNPSAVTPNNKLRDNSASVNGTTPSSAVVSDVSTNGTDPDDDNDGVVEASDSDNNPSESIITPASFVKLIKEVRDCGSSLTSCTGSYLTSATGKPGEYLEYRIRYINISSQPISTLHVSDTLVSATPFQEDTYSLLGGGAVADFSETCPNSSTVDLDRTSPAILTTPSTGAITAFDLNVMAASACNLSTITPGEQGQVLFKVRIP